MTDFPITPVVGQSHTYSGITYEWDGEKWIITPGAVRHNINTTLSGEIDLSKGNFHKLSTNDSKTISFANIPSGSSKWGLEIDIDGVTRYDLVNANNTADVANLALGDTFPTQVYFKPDGTKLFFVSPDTDMVKSFNLNTPWALSSASNGESFSVAGYDSTAIGLTFDAIGSRMYVGGNTTRKIYQFNLSERWNLANTVGLSNTYSVSTVMPNGGPDGIRFSPDGTKFYVLGWPTGTIGSVRAFQYSLSTPWEIATASLLAGSSLLVGTHDAYATSIDFSNDGRKMFIAGDGTDRVRSYTLPTPWQVNTAVYDSVSMQTALPTETTLRHASFKPDGSRLYLAGPQLDTLKEYVTSYSRSPYTGTLTFPTNVVWNNGATPVLSTTSLTGSTTVGTTSIVDFTTRDGGSTIYANERFTKNIAKPYAAPIVPFYSLVYSFTGSSASYAQTTVDISGFRNVAARLVILWAVPSGSSVQTYVDEIVFGSASYGFGGTAHGFQQSGAVLNNYSGVVWQTMGTTAVLGWSAVQDRVGATASIGTLYALAGNQGGSFFFARSPIVQLGESPTLSFYTYRVNAGTLSFYLTNT